MQARADGAIRDEAAEVLTQVAREKALPFASLIPNETTVRAMKEAREGDLHQFGTVQALMDDLHAED